VPCLYAKHCDEHELQRFMELIGWRLPGGDFAFADLTAAPLAFREAEG
jgi:hypothetical protein